jgi:hypothetical protein
MVCGGASPQAQRAQYVLLGQIQFRHHPLSGLGHKIIPTHMPKKIGGVTHYMGVIGPGQYVQTTRADGIADSAGHRA